MTKTEENGDVIISGRGLLREYNALKRKGYTTVWAGDGKICLHPPDAEHSIYECGGCGQYHPYGWTGDCRVDSKRFAGPEDYAERRNVPIHDVYIVAEDGEWESQV